MQFNLPLSIDTNNCVQYELPLNYKQAEITIQSSRIKHYIISDIPITKCSELSFNECPDGATVCTRSLQNVEKVTYQKIGLCLKKVYITVYNECKPPAGESIGQIMAKLNNDQPCSPIKDTPEIQCAGYQKVNCGNEDFNICNINCFWTECSMIGNDNRNTTVFGACIPTTKFKETDQKDACRASYEWAITEEKDKTKVAAVPKWCGGKPPSHIVSDYKERAQNLSWWQSILLLIVLIFFIFLCVVCGYRYEIATGRKAPFNPPEIFPEFVFPRQQNQFYQQQQQYQQTPYNNQYIPPTPQKADDYIEDELVIIEEKKDDKNIELK